MNNKNGANSARNNIFKSFFSRIHPSNYKWFVITIILLLAIFTVLGLFISNIRVLIITENENERLNEDLLKYTDTLHNNLEQANDDYSVSLLQELISSQEISTLVKSEWYYKLSVNGTEIKSDNTSITVPAGTITVELLENEGDPNLPISLHNKGSVTGGDANDLFYEHILSTTTNFTLTPPIAGTNPKTAIYTFDAAAGTSIRLTISEPLKERLNITKDLTITVS